MGGQADDRLPGVGPPAAQTLVTRVDSRSLVLYRRVLRRSVRISRRNKRQRVRSPFSQLGCRSEIFRTVRVTWKQRNSTVYVNVRLPEAWRYCSNCYALRTEAFYPFTFIRHADSK